MRWLAEALGALSIPATGLLIALTIGILLTLASTSFVADRVFPAIAQQMENL